jgi:hypothetical protein
VPAASLGAEDVQRLLKRAYTGATQNRDHLTGEQLDLVISELHPARWPLAHPRLIRILGYAGGPQHRQVLEPFLEGPSAFLATEALWVLCEYWDLTAEYLDTIESYLLGTDWASNSSLGMDAMYHAKAYLHRNRDHKLLRTLYMLSQDEWADENVRWGAFQLLSELIGRNYSAADSSQLRLDVEAMLYESTDAPKQSR